MLEMLSKNINQARGLIISSFFCALLCILIESAEASKRDRGPTADEVATAWIGLDRGGRTAYRFELHSDGQGQAAIAVSKNEPAKVFTISYWEYQRGKIKIVGTPLKIGDESYTPYFTGTITGAAMQLIDKGDTWKIRVELRRETEILGLLDRLQESMSDAK